MCVYNSEFVILGRLVFYARRSRPDVGRWEVRFWHRAAEMPEGSLQVSMGFKISFPLVVMSFSQSGFVEKCKKNKKNNLNCDIDLAS